MAYQFKLFLSHVPKLNSYWIKASVCKMFKCYANVLPLSSVAAVELADDFHLSWCFVNSCTLQLYEPLSSLEMLKIKRL